MISSDLFVLFRTALARPHRDSYLYTHNHNDTIKDGRDEKAGIDKVKVLDYIKSRLGIELTCSMDN